MFELRGKYGFAKVFTDNCDNETISQLNALLNQECVSESKIRIMPDTHAGKGCVIGTTMTLKDKVIPNLVGVDIGCFTGDTEVWCSAGFYKPIKDLVNGNSFMTDSFDLDIKGFVISSAVAKKTRENASLVRVNYGKYSVRCTPDHQFLVSTNNSVYYDSDETELKWIEAKDLKSGMRLVAEDNLIFVNSVEELDETEDVYCLTVEGTHNFTINGGVIVHNCGMLAAKIDGVMDLPKLDSVISKYVPSGFDIHETAPTHDDYLKHLIAPINEDRAYCSLGTLGGGNHFLEVNEDSNGNHWLVIHTGSRHLGIEVCNYYQDKGYQVLKDKASGGSLKEKNKELVERLTREGKQKQISKELAKLRAEYKASHVDIPHELAYVEGDNFNDYIHDMRIVQNFAHDNRCHILSAICKHMGWHVIEEFTTIHNYIDYIDCDNIILRKGSVSAQSGEKLIIPMNMRDGSLICIGKGNSDWNYSAPHGAGRIMSRSEAKESVSMTEFAESMKGIYTTSVANSTIDEAPMVYKPMDEIIKNIQDTVEIVDIIKPIYNFKAH